MLASLDQSLKRLGVDYVDIYYSHRPDPNDVLARRNARRAGPRHRSARAKALYAGVSNYSGAHFCDAVRIAERDRLAPITIHQPYYNMLGRGIETDLLDHTDRHGCGVIAFARWRKAC